MSANHEEGEASNLRHLLKITHSDEDVDHPRPFPLPLMGKFSYTSGSIDSVIRGTTLIVKFTLKLDSPCVNCEIVR